MTLHIITKCNKWILLIPLLALVLLTPYILPFRYQLQLYRQYGVTYQMPDFPESATNEELKAHFIRGLAFAHGVYASGVSTAAATSDDYTKLRERMWVLGYEKGRKMGGPNRLPDDIKKGLYNKFKDE